MQHRWSGAVGAFAGVMTLGLVWTVLGGAQTATPTRFDTIEVNRINVREPDGTLRLAIASHARMPGLIVAGREWPHPNRPEAGMIFYNDQGDENGGLVFDGSMTSGRPTNGGSLTFDRWRQDQTLQLVSTEDGPAREAAMAINDRPDIPMDIAGTMRIRDMPPGPARDRAITSAGAGNARRAYLGRDTAGVSQLVLGDAAGHPRLRLRVAPGGDARVEFLDAAGRVTRTLTPGAGA